MHTEDKETSAAVFDLDERRRLASAPRWKKMAAWSIDDLAAACLLGDADAGHAKEWAYERINQSIQGVKEAPDSATVDRILEALARDLGPEARAILEEE